MVHEVGVLVGYQCAWCGALAAKFWLSRASCVTRAQSPCAKASALTSQEPPTQTTLDKARKAPAFCDVTPPVGQNLTSKNGPLQALSMATPPLCTAGKNFSSVKPSCCASMISLALATPGSRTRSRSRQACPLSLI